MNTQNIKYYSSAKYYKHFIYSIMEHPNTYKIHLQSKRIPIYKSISQHNL